MSNSKKEKVEFIPDKWVFVQLLQKKPATGEGEFGTWYLYSVKVYDEELKVWKEKSFFPSPKLQALIEQIGIEPKKQFAIMQKATVNPETKKAFTYFDVEYEKERFSTKDVDTSPELPPNEPPPDEQKTLLEKPSPLGALSTENGWEVIALHTWNTAFDWITAVSPNIPDEKQAELRLAIVEKSSTILNTRIMQK